MSAPPLPEVFGNYALGDFVEVVAPAAISWWPQTTGWWWLGAVLLVVALHRGWRVARRRYRNRYRREAAAALQQLAAAPNLATLPGDINRLLKLTALAAFPRDQVARLSGADWVSFLNRQCYTAPFAPEQGQLLAEGAYTRHPLEASRGEQLLAASLAWVSNHENPADD